MAKFMEGFIMIEIKNLAKAYICKKAVDNINLTLPRGEIVGLFGENGAGKRNKKIHQLKKCIK